MSKGIKYKTEEFTTVLTLEGEKLYVLIAGIGDNFTVAEASIEYLWDMVVEHLANLPLENHQYGLVRRQKEARAAIKSRHSIPD